MILCITCGCEFERDGKTGPVPKYCKLCSIERAKAACVRYRTSHQEVLNRKSKEYYHLNKDKEVSRNMAYRMSNGERLLEKGRINKRNNRPRYSTYEHRRRAKLNGSEGTYTDIEFAALCSLFDNRCLACGRKVKLTPDHVIPISKGGPNHIYNLQPLCFSCNASKGNHHSTDYRLSKLGIDATVSALG